MSSSSNDEFEDPYNDISNEEAAGGLPEAVLIKPPEDGEEPPGAAEVVECSR